MLSISNQRSLFDADLGSRLSLHELCRILLKDFRSSVLGFFGSGRVGAEYERLRVLSRSQGERAVE